eukprot:1777632-Amphidinium_carterae.1
MIGQVHKYFRLHTAAQLSACGDIIQVLEPARYAGMILVRHAAVERRAHRGHRETKNYTLSSVASVTAAGQPFDTTYHHDMVLNTVNDAIIKADLVSKHLCVLRWGRCLKYVDQLGYGYICTEYPPELASVLEEPDAEDVDWMHWVAFCRTFILMRCVQCEQLSRKQVQIMQTVLCGSESNTCQACCLVNFPLDCTIQCEFAVRGELDGGRRSKLWAFAGEALQAS